MNNGKICVSVCAETLEQMTGKIREARQFADVAELRFDCLKNLDSTQSGKLEKVKREFAGKLLATFRPNDRGQGGNRHITDAERLEFWQSAVSQSADWADIEFDLLPSSFPVDQIRSVWSRLIWSYHAFDVPPNEVDLQGLYSLLAGLASGRGPDKQPDVIKIATRTDDATDAIPVWNILERAKADKVQVIPIGMDDAGKWTRILGLAHGAFMAYVSAGAGDGTAPGQITASDLVELYRVREIDENTGVFGVIGDPISHSLSPYLHNPAFAAAGIDAVFVPFLVKDLTAFMVRMVLPATREVTLNLRGFAVTMPHKQSIIPFLESIDPVARAIGAVNTVRIESDRLVGYNTDAEGFTAPLRARYGALAGARVAVLGAGGAARAVVYALKQEKAESVVFARDERKAAAFADEFGVGSGILKDEKVHRSRSFADFDVLVNSTPIGMIGPLESTTPVTAGQLGGVKCVYDLVTGPAETPLLREARLAGVTAIGGIEMLIAQAAIQFELWTERTAPADIMRRSAFSRMEIINR
jgi:3-dehydroquinate dehydratase / shikimate dehydrogenase